MKRWSHVAVFSLWMVSTASGQAEPTGRETYQPVIDETKGVTLFAFDHVSIPFTRSLKLEMQRPEKHPANPVVARGKRLTPDAWAVQFYGSVIRVEKKFRMWYCAQGMDRFDESKGDWSRWWPAYAESDDGIHWTKPKLGLVEYQGNTENNLVSLEPMMGPLNLKVLYDPEDPDPARRYKMAAHVYFRKTYPDGAVKRHGTLAPYTSADGYRWKLLTKAVPVHREMRVEDLVLPNVHNEPAGGLYKWRDMYYSSGQNPYRGTQPYHARTVRTYRSRDFVEWSQTSTVSFARSGQHKKLRAGNDGKQAHEGVSVWNRGNVLVGLYGMWEGGKTWPQVVIDLGLVVSNDGLRFREALTEWVFLKRGADGQWDQGGLLQGQGFENVGDRTYIYYGACDLRNWQESPPRGGVGLATLPRDRFGHLRVDDFGEGDSEFISTALTTNHHAESAFFVNAHGLGRDAMLKIELLTRDERPLPGYSGSDAAIVAKSGFQTPISWGGRSKISGLPEQYRIKAMFNGSKKKDIRFNALYVQTPKEK